jgi:hypothetical protein
MNRLWVPAAIALLALVTCFQFPGRVWLQEDTQIYAPILEHLRDPGVLAADPMAVHPHVGFTLYDETALALRHLPGLDFRGVLQSEQLVARGFGIWGLYLLATALGLAAGPSLAVAAIGSLGAMITGPALLTIEYEPTPRALALPLMICAMGLLAHRRYPAAAIALSAAILLHPTTAAPCLLLFLLLLLWPGERLAPRWHSLLPLGIAAAILLIGARAQVQAAEAQDLLARLTPAQEALQRFRAAYVWVSSGEWKAPVIAHHLLLWAVGMAALARLWKQMSIEWRTLAVGLPLMGVISMPLSWLLLERAKLAVVPQWQPMRAVLFVTLFFVLLTACAGMRALARRRPLEAGLWLALAFFPPLINLTTASFPMAFALLAVGLGAATVAAAWKDGRAALAIALAAFFVIPYTLHSNNKDNYTLLPTASVSSLSDWARSATPPGAVFLFPDAGKARYPGMFRAQAMRAVYVDWKSGGQVNFVKQFGELWWQRWQEMRQLRFRPADVARYRAQGISYFVLQASHRLPKLTPLYQNADYVAYAVPAPAPAPAPATK